jgi:sec-independent protein translocase protein TatB
MFDFAWSEIALIGVVALIAIGPKDLPVAIKTVAGMIKKARRMAGEFQTHVDEMVREANLDEVRDQINNIRNFDIKGEIEKAVDADGSIRSTLTENPLAPDWTAATPAVETAATDTPVGELPEHQFAADALIDPVPAVTVAAAKPEPPAFVPPEIANRPEPPSFIPPDISSRA